MKGNKRYAAGLSVLLAASMLSTIPALAEEKISVPYEQSGVWDQLVMVNDDAVTTGVNVRATADEDGQVLGYIYKGGAAWIIEKGDEWTEVSSGNLTGYIKNEYLTFGSDISGLADYYGREGVKTTWDDVNLYSEGDASADVVKTIGTNEAFILAEDDGHWLRVQQGADDSVFVSEDDVVRVLLLDTAIAKDSDGSASDTEDTSAEVMASADSEASGTEAAEAASEESYSEDVLESASYASDYEDTSYEESYEEASYTESTDDSSYTESYDDTSSYTEDTTDTYTESSSDSTDTSSDDSSSTTSSLPTGIGYYENGTWYDYYGNAVYSGSEQVGSYDETTGTVYDIYGSVLTSSSSSSDSSTTEAAETTEETYTDTTYTEDTSSEETYTEETETYVEDTSSSSASTDDTSLLAALIYCEAGNQSYEGMVAVGAVVMNRVASPLFPSTISDVIYQSGQFTPASSGALSSALASGVPSSCYSAAVDAINGSNPVGSALYFNTGSGQGVKIGDHQFY